MRPASSPKRPKRLRRRSGTRSLLAAAVAAGAVFAVLPGLRPAGPQERAQAVLPQTTEEQVRIPVPSKLIARGERLDSASITEVTWPKSALRDNFVRNSAVLQGAVALASLPAHLPIPLSAIAEGNTAEANAVIEGIPEGMRAITVRVDAESAVEGWARSGSYVDVILLRQSLREESGIEAKVIAENIRILSAGRSTEPLAGETSAPQAPATVTLLVSQEDALKIKTAATVGKLTFSLRGKGDADPTIARSVNQRELIGGARTVIPEKKEYIGRATGPDGKVYLLGTNSRWVRSLDDQDRPSVIEEEGSK